MVTRVTEGSLSAVLDLVGQGPTLLQRCFDKTCRGGVYPRP